MLIKSQVPAANPLPMQRNEGNLSGVVRGKMIPNNINNNTDLTFQLIEVIDNYCF